MDFSTARNVRIKKSMFNIAHRDIINNYHAQDTHSCVHSVMKDHINTDAFHDSGARRDPSRCYPGTRETALEIISSWVQDPAAHYFWLYGPAGTGKSAIAQTFAEWCEQEKTLGATYFFTRGSTSGPPRGVPPLFSTLAYQLMSKFPGLDDYLWAAVDADRTIFERSLSAQFDKLIVQPFLKLAYKSAVAVVIIDGLDECDGDSIQEEIVRLILGLEQHSLPLLFLISSRPEPAIRRSFKLSSSSLTHFPLDKALDPDDDIHYYLVNEFERIYQESLEMGMPPVSQLPWPSARDIGKLVDKSSGHFIYAATVVRFVQEDHSHPMDRLDAILGIPGKSTNALATQNIFAHSAAFQDLDRLYLHILHRGRGRVELSKILRAIMDFAPYDAWPGNIETIFDLTPGSVPIMLAGLHSIIDVPVDDQPLPFLHASFKDFLADPKRSTQEFYLETSRFNADLACQYMRLIVEFSPSKSGHALTMAIAGLRDCLRATANLLVDTLRKFTNIIIQAPKSIPPCLLYVILDFLLQDVLKVGMEVNSS
ncbi:hypothetical protein BD779DRAFT_283091 [Infundibulicybe gibba]|nr:hypothetical protein BD779DRAFT_283091 [Infundibulicybe gibba]